MNNVSLAAEFVFYIIFILFIYKSMIISSNTYFLWFKFS